MAVFNDVFERFLESLDIDLILSEIRLKNNTG